MQKTLIALTLLLLSIGTYYTSTFNSEDQIILQQQYKKEEEGEEWYGLAMQVDFPSQTYCLYNFQNQVFLEQKNREELKIGIAEGKTNLQQTNAEKSKCEEISGNYYVELQKNSYTNFRYFSKIKEENSQNFQYGQSTDRQMIVQENFAGEDEKQIKKQQSIWTFNRNKYGQSNQNQNIELQSLTQSNKDVDSCKSLKGDWKIQQLTNSKQNLSNCWQYSEAKISVDGDEIIIDKFEGIVTSFVSIQETNEKCNISPQQLVGKCDTDNKVILFENGAIGSISEKILYVQDKFQTFIIYR